MGVFLERFQELLDTEFIQPSDWYDIVNIADEETLIYMRDFALTESKYGKRDDWLSYGDRDELLSIIDDRLRGINSLVMKWFGDIIIE